jgi:membrane-associated phospholipid phosphatase
MVQAAYDSGVNIILYLQSLGDWLIDPMRFITFLGDEEFLVLLMPTLYWSINAVLGLRVGVLSMFSSGFVFIFQLAFHSPRPFFYAASVRAFAEETTFGFPSGHAMNGITMWGLIALALRRTWTWIALVILIFLIGLSRVVLGVHFPVDVIGGWLFGLLLLYLFLLLEGPVLARLSRQTLPAQIIIAFAVSVALILAAAWALFSVGQLDLLPGWLRNAAADLPGDDPINPLSLSRTFTAAGLLFGFTAGALWLYDRSGFDASGSLANRLLRYPLGLLGVLVLWYGLGLVFPRGDYLLAYLLRYIRYALVGLWISALAPLLFIRLGLASAAKED